MSDAAPETTDHGLFLVHLRRGRELLDERHYGDAEVQLEEAYFLRPRDPAVLNLLGLAYFRQQKLDKAEEVYRKLLAHSPDEPTLSYNLGVIYLKLNRLEEAETALLKALDLSESNPRISFYLGTVYERQRRFQDAIFHYRQAGASAMVRRLEDRMAATRPTSTAPPAHPAHRRESDTAEFKAAEIRAALQRQAPPPPPEPPLVPPKALTPVSPAILSPDGHRETAPAEPQTPLVPPPTTRVPPVPPAPHADSTLRPSEAFRFIEPHLLEVDCTGKVFVRQGSIHSYSGDLTFWVKDQRPGVNPPLIIITGRGRLLLTDKDREITLMHVDEETIHVEPSHLLACEETLTPRYVRLSEGVQPPLEFVQLEGRGRVALSVLSRPLPLNVTPDLPISLPAPSIIMWSGSLQPRAIVDRQIFEVLHTAGSEPPFLVRLEGTGRILVEQARRT